MRNLVLIAASLLAGCATSSMTGYRDPDFQARQYESVAVLALVEPNQQQAFAVATCKALAPLRCQDAVAIVPPTREWGEAEISQRLRAAGVEALIVVEMGKDRTRTGIAGYYTSPTTTTATGSATMVGNTAYASGTAQTTGGTTTPIRYINRAASATVSVHDLESSRNAYVGTIDTAGSGLIGASDSAFTKSIAAKLAAELKSAGVVP